MPVLRYDPELVGVLHVRVQRAVAELATITSGDPAATVAVDAVRAARVALEQQWLPLLADVVNSDAMVTWDGAGLRGVDGLNGSWFESLAAFGLNRASPLGQALADTARTIIEDPDVDDIVALTAGLRQARGDVAAMRTFVVELGGKGVAELLMVLGYAAEDADEALELAAVVRARVAEDSRRTGFPGDFAGALVDRFIGARDDERWSAAAAMSYLFDDADFGTDMLVATTAALVAEELEAAGDEPEYGADLWFPGPMPSILLRELDDDGDGSSEYACSADPMYMLLDAIARDGEAGRAVFTDDVMAPYLLGQRHLYVDGMRRLAAAAETAAAGADVVTGAPPAMLDAAGLVASAFVNYVGARPVDELDYLAANDDVSRSVATILGQHMLAVQNAVLVGGQDTTGARRSEPVAAIVEIKDEARGDGVVATVASFDEPALGVMTDLAVDSTEGLATIRAALDLHARTQATVAIGRLAADDLPTGRDPNLFLAEAMQDAARLEAHLIADAGHRAEERGRSVDSVISVWIGLASLSIGTANGHYGAKNRSNAQLTAPVIGELLAPAAEVATSLFATHEAQAARSAEANAEAATDQQVYLWCREAYTQGVIVPDLPSEAVVGGQLVEWEDFLQLPASVRQQTLNHLEETTGRSGINLDSNGLRDVVKTEQLPIYQQLD